MKKLLSAVMAFVLILALLSGCSDDAGSSEQVTINPPSSLPSSTQTAEPDSVDTAKQDNVANDDTVDVDLASLSSTMVYAEVYNMMMTPEDYVGKTIKMKGLYYASPNPEMDIIYHFVIIEDATACCAQGLEFIWNGEHTYPEDFPSSEVPVEVTGVWGSYEELGNIYYYVAADSVTPL